MVPGLNQLSTMKNALFWDVTPCGSCKDLATLLMNVLCSSETSVPTRATRRNTLDDGILHSHRPENLKDYIALTG
jgi:hypothetical protein